MTNWIAALPATIHTKLLTVYVVIALLLLSAAGVGLLSLREMNARAQEIAQLQRKIAAYRQLNHDTIAQLYGVATALLQPEERRFDATLRQLKQFGYDLDRLQYLSQDEMVTMARIRARFEEFIQVVTRVVELIRAGKVTEGQRLQLSVATPLADQLERDTNHLVNKAEADMIAGIDLANEVYGASRRVVIVCGLISVALALGLGYLVSRSLIDPIRRMGVAMRQLSQGDFSTRVEVANRDELGTLAEDVNRTSAELGRLYAQLEALRENAERANQEKSQFLAAASHDLRQPMNAIALWVNNLQVALATRDERETRRALEAIESSSRSLGASFNAILDLSRFDARALVPALVATDVRALCARLTDEFEPTARQTGLTLRFHAGGSAPLHARTDEVMLGRVLRNLLGNAFKFCRRGGVVLGVVTVGDVIKISVCDTGIGIDRAHWADLFKEFYQVPGSVRDRERGVGLGLSIVRKSVDLLEGHALDLYSRPGFGSRFTVRLPRAAASTLPPPESGGVGRSAHLAGAYVVVIDDEPLVLQGMSTLLQHWGCLVAAGKSLADLVRVLHDNERIPDVLITDWRLAGGETGAQVIEVTEREVGRALPVIVMTGDPVLAAHHGHFATQARWMQKPLDATELRNVLEAMVPARLVL